MWYLLRLCLKLDILKVVYPGIVIIYLDYIIVEEENFFKFNHWRESISSYKKYIEVKYTPPIDYLVFLDKMGYAEDPNYISKVQTIMNRHEDDNNKRRSNYESG